MKSIHYLLATIFSLSALSAEDPSEEIRNVEISDPAHFQPILAYEIPYRFLANRDPMGFSLEMDDGSIWRIIDSSSAREVSSWRINDSLVIYPTLVPSWSGGRYYIVNQNLQSSAIAEISYGPLAGKATNTQIVYFDYFSGYVQLQDGIGRTSFWRLYPSDRSIFEYWKVGQSIIIGSNENCYAGWFCSSPYILINVERNDYVRATIE